MAAIKKILIANRGEIAMRIIKTCREMDIKTVSLYTMSETDLPHAVYGDESVCLGEGALSETYLNIDKIINIAKERKVDAIHPGYGFLSENAKFAQACLDAKITFIGPSIDAIKLMGDKKQSKNKIVEIGAPSIPGYHGDNQEKEFLKKEAIKIGFPVLVKASAGGGGKGMKIVNSAEEFEEGLDSAKREAMNAFGDDIVLIEKYITGPRHIEVQVMGDTFGNVVHLFERECSIQRRYQKVVEETPSTALDYKLRKEITSSAVNIAKSINYVGAGTVEYILDTDGAFYFLEMNTRLQVEHPITEMITGLDLVRMQIEVASGEKLKVQQEDIISKGHAIELRIYGEDPANNFLPSIGKISQVGILNMKNSRLDTGYGDGNSVTIDFDPMLAKLVCHGETREEAIRKSLLCLEDVPFLGVKTNSIFLSKILRHPKFIEGETYTHFIDTHKEDLLLTEGEDDLQKASAIAAFLFAKESPAASSNKQSYNAWNKLSQFRNV